PKRHWSSRTKGWLRILAFCAACVPASIARARAGVVRLGIDVLLSDSIHLVRGKAVGLVSNQAGVDAAGVSDVERLLQARVRLIALFSAEQGFRGTPNPGASVPFTTDS